MTALDTSGTVLGTTVSLDGGVFSLSVATGGAPLDVVLRGSYGIYRNLGVYESLALFLAQQPPFAKTFSVQNTRDTRLTLANPFPATVANATNTFAIDPGFRSADGFVIWIPPR